MLVTAISFIPRSFADGFESPLDKLTHNPTICAFEPSPDPKYPPLGNDMLNQAYNAVLDWEQKLNLGYGKHPAWNMNFVKVPLAMQGGFDDSSCDISIYFKPKPDNPDLQLLEAGVTYTDTINHKAKIEIYYLGVNLKWKVDKYIQGNYLVYSYTPTLYFTGYLASDPQLADTIRHELGHAFGLGHYIVPTDVLYRITKGQQDSPSIMIKTVIGYGVTHYDITLNDIWEMKKMYGYDGFSANQSPTPATIKTITAANHTLETDRTYYVTGDMVKISGFLFPSDDATTYKISVVDPQLRMIGKYTIPAKKPGPFSLSLDTSAYRLAGNYTMCMLAGQENKVLAQSMFELIPPPHIPIWIKNNALRWSEGNMTDSGFVKSIQYLIQQGVIKIPNVGSYPSSIHYIPAWIKNNAGWWAKGIISDDEFVGGLQYLIDAGVIGD